MTPCGNKERTLSTSKRNRQSLSSERAGEVGVANGVPESVLGNNSEGSGSCKGGTAGTVCSLVASTPINRYYYAEITTHIGIPISLPFMSLLIKVE